MTLRPPEPRSDIEETVLLDWRRRKNRRRLILKITIGLLLLAVIAAGIYVVGFSRLLSVRSVQVDGVQTLNDDEVRAVAAVPSAAPLARVDIGAVEQRVEAIKQVESAEVSRGWPDSVRIRIVERTAIYAVRRDADALLVDRHGVGFLAVPTTEAAKLPRAVIDAGDEDLLRSLATVVAALPKSLQSEVDRIEATGRDSITLRLSDGRTVVWGSEAESDLKAEVIMVLLKQKGDHYDVSAPGNPAVR